jgi:hypothetical protein
MCKKIHRIFFICTGLLTALALRAQPTESAGEKMPEMADAMRSNGKIYVVIAVILIILFGLILYVFRLDKKIGKLEREK